MATVDTQTLPPELADLWAKAFLPTTPAGLVRTDVLTDRASNSAQTEFMANWRTAFAHVAALVEQQPENESHAWFRLALDTGLEWWNLFMQVNIRDVYNGTPDPSIVRPHASVYERIYETGFAQMVIWDFGNDAHELTFDMTVDPVTPLPPTDDLPGAAYVVYEYAQVSDGENVVDVWQVHFAETPAIRTHYRQTVGIPARDAVYRELTWMRRTADYTGESILWALELDDLSGQTAGFQMNPAEPYF